MDCIFCKIVNLPAGEKIPTELVYEDSEIIAFNDVHPVAPIHILIIPKKHIETINDLSNEDGKLVGKMIIVARDLAKKLKISENGYKLLFRTGKDGGQEVSHIHLHLIGGAKLFEDIRPI